MPESTRLELSPRSHCRRRSATSVEWALRAHWSELLCWAAGANGSYKHAVWDGWHAGVTASGAIASTPTASTVGQFLSDGHYEQANRSGRAGAIRHYEHVTQNDWSQDGRSHQVCQNGWGRQTHQDSWRHRVRRRLLDNRSRRIRCSGQSYWHRQTTRV